MADHLYIVVYDIADPRRWRQVFRIMNGFGEWVQLSVFQCRLSRTRRAELEGRLDDVIHHDEDHIVIMDMGKADSVSPRVSSLGKSGFEPVANEPTIV